jgi:hypothetical protein
MSRIIKPVPSFSPRQLFARGRQGVWCEPGPTQCFTDTAGTTPATAGQAVAKITELSAGRSVIQSTAANRPTLSARYTLLEYSDTFNTAFWSAIRIPGIVSTNNVAPDGSNTAYRFNYTAIYQSFTTPELPTGTYLLSFWAKVESGTKTYHLVDSNGTRLVTTFVLTTSWQFFRYSWTVISNGTIAILQEREATGFVNTYLWHPDLRIYSTPSGIPPYQRIAAATDYDTTGFPWRLVHNGTDYLTATLPALSGGNYSTTASVYFGTPQGMSSLHNQSIGTSYNLTAPNTDVYGGWVVVPSRLTPPEEEQLARYFRAKAGIVGSEAFLYEQGYGFLTADNGKYRLLRR